MRRLYEVAESSHHAEAGGSTARRASPCWPSAATRGARCRSPPTSTCSFLAEDAEAAPFAKRALEIIQYALWDANVEVGAALRTIDECIELGQQDETARTTLLAARFLAGDAGAVPRARRSAVPRALVAGRRERSSTPARGAARSGTGTLRRLALSAPAEPQGGGRRAARLSHRVLGGARRRAAGARASSDFLHAGLLTEGEAAELRDALDFLWRTRNQLHLAGRPQARPARASSMQEQMARALRLSRRRRRAAGRALHARLLPPRARDREPLRDRDRAVSRARAAGRRAPRPHRARWRRASGSAATSSRSRTPRTCASGRCGCCSRSRWRRTTTCRSRAPRGGWCARTSHLVRRRASSATRRAAATFLRILGSPYRVMRTLMALNETGLLGRYLPEWEHIVCRWQHVIYHTYTVDVHSIFLVEELRRLWKGKYERALPELTELVRERRQDLPGALPRLPAARHRQGPAAATTRTAGVELARALLERLGLVRGAPRAGAVRRAPPPHHVAHRAPAGPLGPEGDRRVRARGAATAQSLRDLYLATFADTRASSSSGWTEWRGELLRELYERTSEFLESGDDDPERAAALAIERVERAQGRGARRAAGARRRPRRASTSSSR